ncbi:MAG TPA: aminoacyl-tRNA hydrolase [Steroidobacteraceae bacterium]|nr:aminoacyl-tRNA hydrolase [Steroidobacteraceae bacterium]
MAGTPLQIIVGLGNPGPEHQLTRHNAGFWFVDALARSQAVQFRSHSRYQGEVAKVTVEGQELILLKPQTYMNRSGLAVRSLIDYVKAPLSEVLVVHDELDLPPGTVRLKLGGGHGGHNGLRDVITHCGPDFWRLRLGIGHPGEKSEVIDYVLQRAAASEEQAVVDSLGAALDALPVFLREGAEKAMQRLHTGSKGAA